MAGYHGKSGVFYIESSGGTFYNIATESQSIAANFDVPLEEVTGFADTAQEFVAGIEGATLTLEGNWDDTTTTGTDTILWAIKGLKKEFRWAPGGSATSRRKYTGSAFLNAYNPTANVRGKLGYSATFTCSGAVTGSTI